MKRGNRSSAKLKTRRYYVHYTLKSYRRIFGPIGAFALTVSIPKWSILQINLRRIRQTYCIQYQLLESTTKLHTEKIDGKCKKDNDVDQKRSKQTTVYFFIDLRLVSILEKSYLCFNIYINFENPPHPFPKVIGM